jgi:DnaJ-domain-containing protein 1
VLTGHFQGARLSSLGEEELVALYREICSDTDSVSLLTSFLDRSYPDWRDRVDSESFGRAAGSSGFAEMTKQEAYQILGLEPGASQQEIQEAWRRLIKAVHPDHGGSPFLSAKINAARDLLLD